MHLSQMRYFQAACQYSSLSKAAVALHISQPSISIAIRDLEKEFGVSLFDRTNKQLLLTQEGRYFLEQVNKILHQIASLETQMCDMGWHRNNLRISALPITGTYLLPPILSAFREVSPKIRIELNECSSRQGQKRLEGGQCDVALSIMEQSNLSQFNGVILQRTEFLYCVATSHPKAHLKQVEIADLQDDTLILFQDDSFLTTQVKHRFLQLGLTPNVMLYAVHLPLVAELLTSGRTGTFLTREMASTQPGIAMIPLAEPIEVVYALVWRKNKIMHRDVSRFISFIQAQYPDTLLCPD